MIYSFHHKLMKTYASFHKKVMKDSKALNLTSGQPKVLEFLSNNEGVCQTEIAQHCEIEKATVGELLDRMEEMNLIIRKRVNGNRRSIFIYLTEEGKSKAKIVKEIFDINEKNAFKNISESDQIFFNKILDQVYLNLQKMEDKG